MLPRGSVALVPIAPVRFVPSPSRSIFGLRFQVERAGCGSYPRPAGHNSGMTFPVDGVTERQRPNGLGLQIRQLTHAYQSLVSPLPCVAMPSCRRRRARFWSTLPGGARRCGSYPGPAGHNSGMALPVDEVTERNTAERARSSDPAAHARVSGSCRRRANVAMSPVVHQHLLSKNNLNFACCKCKRPQAGVGGWGFLM